MGEEKQTCTEHKCLCQTEEFKKFLIVTFGSFVGVFAALSLFAALHKPPMPVYIHDGFSQPPIYYQIRNERKMFNEGFDKHNDDRHFDQGKKSCGNNKPCGANKEDRHE